MAYLDRQALQDINARRHVLVKEVVSRRFVFWHNLQLQGCTKLCKQTALAHILLRSHGISWSSPSAQNLKSHNSFLSAFYFFLESRSYPHFKSRKHKAPSMIKYSRVDILIPTFWTCRRGKATIRWKSWHRILKQGGRTKREISDLRLLSAYPGPMSVAFKRSYLIYNRRKPSFNHSSPLGQHR